MTDANLQSEQLSHFGSRPVFYRLRHDGPYALSVGEYVSVTERIPGFDVAFASRPGPGISDDGPVWVRIGLSAWRSDLPGPRMPGEKHVAAELAAKMDISTRLRIIRDVASGEGILWPTRSLPTRRSLGALCQGAYHQDVLCSRTQLRWTLGHFRSVCSAQPVCKRGFREPRRSTQVHSANATYATYCNRHLFSRRAACVAG